MRVLVLHSDVAPDARPDEQDTLLQAAAVEAALRRNGHAASCAAFPPDLKKAEQLVRGAGAEVVFNLVESVWGKGQYAAFAAQILSDVGVPFTGSTAATIAASSDKLLAKRLMTGAGLPTPLWSEPPAWRGLEGGGRWIVKAADEDASLGLDDDAVVTGPEAADRRAHLCAARFGGRWFAERYVEGREFNVAVLARGGDPLVLPIGEMRFLQWDEDRPRILGYAAKWDTEDEDFRRTKRVFDWYEREPDLRKSLEHLAKACWALFRCRGYARIDIRLDAEHRPFILEVNANPCLEPDAGFAAAARQGGISYDELVAHVLAAAA